MKKTKKAKKKVKAKKRGPRSGAKKPASGPSRSKSAKKKQAAKNKGKGKKATTGLKTQTKPPVPPVKAQNCQQRDESGLFLPGNTVGINVPHNTSLTPQIGKILEELWKLSGPDSLSDREIADRIGVTYNKLQGWLKRNTKVKLTKIVGVNKNTGQNITRIEMIGLRHLRTRARSMLKIGYLSRMNKIVEDATMDGKHNAAYRAQAWLLEHQFPKQFGKHSDVIPLDKPKLIRTPLKPPNNKKKKNGKKGKK